MTNGVQLGMRGGLSPQDQKILNELMAGGAINPAQVPTGAIPSNAYGAMREALQTARPQGGSVPINVPMEDPVLATPADRRIGVGPAMLGAIQDPMVQRALNQQPVAGSPVQSNVGPPPNPMSPAQRAGPIMPQASGAPGQAPMPMQNPQDEILRQIMLAQGG